MHWLQSADTAAFYFINHTLANRGFNLVMPWFSGNPLFIPALFCLAAWLLWRGGARGRVYVVMMLLLVLTANNFVVGWLKHLVDRPRPFLTLPPADIHVLIGRGGSGSMPSGHAANCFAATLVTWIYYRRSLRFLLPLAIVVAFSRVYNGVHYPSDVLAGAALGALIGGGGVWGLDRVWRFMGRRWFPLWFRQFPSLVEPVVHRDPLAWQPDAPPVRDPKAVAERQWLYLGYGFIAILLLIRLVYIGSDIIDLSKDEAYQWLWSKHLALSYVTKPPLIAYIQWLGTHLWGDTAFGIRFFAPVITALLGGLTLRFFAREVNARTGFFLLLALSASPLVALGSILLTIDVPSVLFWATAMFAGWRAAQAKGTTRDWLWVGLWIAMGFLSKYTNALEWVSFALFFLLWPAARRHLRRPGPYLAVAVSALGALPVILWNARHHWVTLFQLEGRAGLSTAWHPSLRYFTDFCFAQFGLLNPVFFCAILWAIVQVWRKRRHDPLLLYFLCMGAPLYFGYWAYTARTRVLPNWIAPAVLPLFCLLFAYADSRWRAGVRAIRRWLVAGLAIGLPIVVLFHQSNLIGRLIGHQVPPHWDPLRRVRGWQAAAAAVGQERQELEQKTGKPTFIICDHYGITSLFTFYLPAAKKGVPNHPLIYYQWSKRPENQFFYWPSYLGREGQDIGRKGENAVYVTEVDEPEPIPPRLKREFASVVDLGLRAIHSRGRVYRHLQFFACYGLK